MPTFAPPFAGKLRFQTGAKLTPTLGAGLLRLADNAAKLADPSFLQSLLEAVMSATVLVEYQKRFLAELPEAVNTERYVRRKKTGQVSEKLRRRVAFAYEAERRAVLAGDPDRIARAQRAIGQAQEAVRNAALPRGATVDPLPSGNYRDLALQLLYLEASANQIRRAESPAGTIRLGVGSMAALAQYQTPSATQELTGNPTTSEYTQLWRQLEFGTGKYAKPSANVGSRFRLPGGGWTYGGLDIVGTRGVHALRDPITQLPYGPDASKLRSTFARTLRRVLLGK